MLRIFKIILYLILINIYVNINFSNASFIDFLKNIFSNNDTNDDNILNNNNRQVELKVPVNNYILNQIKKINNLAMENKEKSKLRDNNFNEILTEQQQILGILNEYHYDNEVFDKCISNANKINAVIEFYNILFREGDEFSQLIIDFNEEVKNHKDPINKLYKSFNKILSIMNFIKLIFKDCDDGLINKLSKLDNTVSLNENEIKNLLNKYIHQLDILLDKDTIEYYNDILSELYIKVRTKNETLPSQLLFMLFNNIREKLSNQSKELQSIYINYKNKVTIINQRSEAIETYMRDNTQQTQNIMDINNILGKKNPKEAICVFISTNISEYNKINRDITDEIDKMNNFTNSIIESLEQFKNYIPDERILSLILKKKEDERNRIKNNFKKLTKKPSNENESKSETKHNDSKKENKEDKNNKEEQNKNEINIDSNKGNKENKINKYKNNNKKNKDNKNESINEEKKYINDIKDGNNDNTKNDIDSKENKSDKGKNHNKKNKI